MGAMDVRSGRLGFAGLMLWLGCGADPAPSARPDSGGGRGDAQVPTLDASGASGAPDAGQVDAGAGCVPFEMPEDCSIPEGAALPSDLRCTGLYGSWEQRQIACGVEAYAPAHELYSDGARKQRYVWLPPGSQVDVSASDAFRYPDGTRFWKEFWLERDGAWALGETRLLEKTPRGWIYTSYVWSEDGEQAVQVNDGVQDLFGTGHTVPTRDQCDECHAGREDRVLGWDGLLLGAGASGLDLARLVDEGWVAREAAEALPTSVPGDPVEQAALAYLHVNCGVSCHNDSTEAAARDSGLFLRLEAGELASVQATDAITSGVDKLPDDNVKLEGLSEPEGGFYAIRPGDPQRSLLLVRMQVRGVEGAMPRIGTNVVDEAGVATVQAWIESMPSAE